MIPGLFFTVLAFFLSGLSGTIPSYRDSGDLIASMHTMGIAHPPGYAAYVLVGKLFHLLVPFGNPAYKTNLFSAVCGALAAAGLFALLRRKTSAVLAVLLTVVFVSAPAVVTLSRVSEMYAMAMGFAVLILLVADSESPHAPTFIAFLLGVGFNVHPTLLSLLPLLLVSSPSRPLAPAPKRFLFILLAFLLGLSLCLYLPVRAFQNPVQNWGDPSTWRQFWRVVTRADYGGLKLHPEQSQFIWSAPGIVQQLVYLAKALSREWGAGVVALGLAGWAWLLRGPDTRRKALSGIASLLIAGPLFFLLSNLPLQEATTPAILEPYLLIPGILLLLGAALALQTLWIRWKPVGLVLTAGLLALSPWTGWSLSQRQDFLTYDYGRNLLHSLPPDAVLYDPDDPTSFTLRTLQVTQQRRTDVILLNFFRTAWGYEHIRRQWPELLPPVRMENAQQLQEALWSYSIQRHPFYGELPQKLGNRVYRTEGLVYAVNPRGPSADGFARSEALWALYARRGVGRVTDYPDFFSRHLVGYYAAAHCNLGLDYANAGQTERALFHYRAALAMDPALSAAWNNWGNLLYFQKNYSGAAAIYDEGLRRCPNDPSLQNNRMLAKSFLK